MWNFTTTWDVRQTLLHWLVLLLFTETWEWLEGLLKTVKYYAFFFFFLISSWCGLFCSSFLCDRRHGYSSDNHHWPLHLCHCHQWICKGRYVLLDWMTDFAWLTLHDWTFANTPCYFQVEHITWFQEVLAQSLEALLVLSLPLPMQWLLPCMWWALLRLLWNFWL